MGTVTFALLMTFGHFPRSINHEYYFHFVYNQGTVEVAAMFTRFIATPLLFMIKFYVKSLARLQGPHRHHQDAAAPACDAQAGAARVPEEAAGGAVEQVECAHEWAVEFTAGRVGNPRSVPCLPEKIR